MVKKIMINRIITGRLKALTGIHVGSGESSDTTDLPIFKSSNGELVIPGTAIAGALRSLATRIAPHLGYKKCVVLGGYLFRWEDIPGKDSQRLIDHLEEDLKIAWAKNAEITKSDDNKTIKITKKKNLIVLDHNKEKNTMTLKTSDETEYDYILKQENGKLNIYPKICDCPVCDLFGSINPEKEEGEASKIWVYDAVLDRDRETSIRDGVGIDRETKTSASEAGAKYDLEIIPRNALFDFRIELQGNVKEEGEILLASILLEWINGRCFIGGNLARGLGWMQLEDIKSYTLDLSSPENLMRFLRDDDTVNAGIEDNFSNFIKKIKIKKRVDDQYLYNSFAQIEFILEFTGGFVVNDELAGTRANYDFCPRRENGEFVLPGSSLRGVLRSHAEKIARTLITLKVDNERDFLSRCPACNPNIDTSCNSLLRKYRKKHRIPPEEKIKEGELCPACQFFGSTYKGSRLYVSDSYLMDSPQIKIMDFLAVDRFTGGEKHGAKFDAIVLWRPSFKVHIFLENPKGWQLGWLMLVLRDLTDGMLSIGFGGNKWFGKVGAMDIAIKMGDTYNSEINDTGIFEIKDQGFEKLIDEKGSVYINEFHEFLNKFRFHEFLNDFRKEKTYLFSWDKIPGNDNGKLIEFLRQKFGIDWIKTAKVEKIDGFNTINIFTKENNISLKLNDEKTEVNLKIDDVRTDKFATKLENNELNIYEKTSDTYFGRCDELYPIKKWRE
ncbi:MAG: hypothetical protein A7315_04635 [Candidatus Altiarchaeales archaeon WOR_SM1_79]|nr:MAG: hypothetical protein A7315_04635 [Candidatus Altiarchaeales archaeon WOR_SM1_79]